MKEVYSVWKSSGDPDYDDKLLKIFLHKSAADAFCFEKIKESKQKKALKLLIDQKRRDMSKTLPVFFPSGTSRELSWRMEFIKCEIKSFTQNIDIEKLDISHVKGCNDDYYVDPIMMDENE